MNFQEYSDFKISGTILDRYVGKGGAVVIPDGITEIGAEAFKNSRITSITIPTSVTSVGYWAFGNCKSLISITIGEPSSIPDGIRMYAWAFKGCEIIRHIHIHNNIIYSAAAADIFSKTFTSVHVEIGNNVECIDTSILSGIGTVETFIIGKRINHFKETTALKGPTRYGIFPKSTPYIKTVLYDGTLRDWCHIRFDSFRANPISGCGEFCAILDDGESHPISGITIPGDLKKIPRFAFYGLSKIEYIIIAEGVDEICDEAFAFCNNVERVSLPESLKTIGPYAFYEDTPCKLCDVYLSKSIEEIHPGAFNEKLTRIYYAGTEAEWHNTFFDGGNKDLTCHCRTNICFNCTKEMYDELKRI